MSDQHGIVRWQQQVPVTIREVSTLSRPDYTDVVIASTSHARTKSPEEWFIAFRRGAPAWVRVLARAGGGTPRRVPEMVIDRGEDWILLEEPEGLMITQYVCHVDRDEVTLAFLMQYRRRAARLIWPVMSLIHRRIAIITMQSVLDATEISASSG